MEEVWKDINGFGGRYQVSDKGRVKSIKRRIGYGMGYITPEKILKAAYDKDGYEQVGITVANRKNKSYKIHHLVATHFIANDTDGNIICHKDA